MPFWALGIFVFPVSPQSSETCYGVFRSPRSDPYRLFSLNRLFALVPAGSRLGWWGTGNWGSRPLDRVSGPARPSTGMQLQMFRAQEVEPVSPGPRRQIESEEEQKSRRDSLTCSSSPIRVFTSLGRLIGLKRL